MDEQIKNEGEKTKTENEATQTAGKEERKVMKPTLVVVAMIILVAITILSAKNLVVGAVTVGQQTETSTSYYTAPAETASDSSKTVTGQQTAKLSLVDFRYTLTPNKMKKGVPVRIEVDASTLSGCMKTVTFRDFGIMKRITASDNVIEFTPDKTGTFWITCSMGMGAGSFEVINEDGTPDVTAKTDVQAPPTTGGCGMGGGCGGGCGG